MVPILGYKNLDALPPRVLTVPSTPNAVPVHYLPLTWKAALSGRYSVMSGPFSTPPEQSADQQTELFVESVVEALPAQKDSLEKYRQAQATDEICSKIMEFCHSGWPAQHSIKGDLKKYWHVRSELTVAQNLLLFRQRIVVPKCLRKETLSKIHSGHQGILRCRLRVSNSVWWPGVSGEVEKYVQSCSECLKVKKQPKEPLVQTDLPEHPWEKVASDLFEFKNSTYNYFSG